MKNYSKENYGKDKNAWLNHRGIGGTSASAIVGLNPYQTKLDIYCAIENPKEEKDEATGERVDYGRKLEPLIRSNIEANFSHKYKVRNPKGFEMYRRKDKPYMTATLDGTMTSLTDPKEKWVIEIKTHDMGDSEDRAKWEGKEIPQHYLIQCLHYLSVLNDYVGVLFVAKLRYMNFDTDEPYKETILYLKIERKDYQDTIADLEKAITNFWENNVMEHVPPAVKDLSLMKEEEESNE